MDSKHTRGELRYRGTTITALTAELIVKEERQRPSFTHQFVHSFTPSYLIYFLNIYRAFPMG